MSHVSTHDGKDDFPQPQPLEDLPAYETALADTPPSRNDIHVPSPSQPPTFILDKCAIHALLEPDRLLYELSNPPCQATTSIYGVEKIRYKTSERQGEVKVRSRVDHIYDFHNNFMSLGMRDVEILGKASSKRVYPKVKMSQGLGPSSFSIKDHFKVEQPVLDRMQSGTELVWKDNSGVDIAHETLVDRDEQGNVTRLPQLKMKVVLEEKDLDLLVTCWCARLWKEAQKDLAEPFSWDKFKRYTTATTSTGGWKLRTLMNS
ncbi:hypothetical protein BGZ61DRAFT_403929 [Ilyonectria robusta]|uniref:uncharacterized protein n=1 Tax=Ilyonectria robusta TaxID=1079257 RepID=UPI001E8D6F9A|nr:uncharacterized protein BGZ61DRAFT_403929 [Ilyonectria robusta]KAH8658947.1 hypothetical protein BGZ61DRAFT_403929 [Ilyonectria robusta]